MANKIYLWDKGRVPGLNPEIDQEEPSILHIPAAVVHPHAAVVVAPGGGYVYKEMEKEGVRIAEALNVMGVTAFVLDYRVLPYALDVALIDAQRAIRTVRYGAGHYGIDPDKIGIMGFSAGGHLTGMCSVHFDAGDPDSPDPVERMSCRPDFSIPCYGVLDFSLTPNSEETYQKFGIDYINAWRYCPARIVREDTPPAFLWHTAEDSMVSAAQSMRYALALHDKGISCELHVYGKGPHGMGLAVGDTSVSQWTRALENWLHAGYWL